CHRGATENAGLVTFANNAWRNGRAVRFSQIEAPELTLENDSGEVTTSGGPGLMKLFQLGDPLETTTSPRPERVSPAEQVFRLTRVEFAGPMHANNHDKIQSATFSGPVRVAHAPTDNPNLIIDPDRLPPGAFRLTCQSLEILAHTEN